MRAVALGCFALSLACAPELEETATLEAPIIGGVETEGFPEVVFMTNGVGACTGTLVAPRLVLTAAHCVMGPSGPVQGGTVRFGSGSGGFTDSRAILRSLPHRRYEFGAVTRFDVAFVRLASDAPAGLEPYTINQVPLTDNDLNMPVRVVGFGFNDGVNQTGAGIKREIGLSIDELTDQHIGLGNTGMNICQGDSGGPTLIVSGTPTVLAVSSFGREECRDRSFVARTDVHPDFVAEVLSAWGDGECSQDGTCNSSCTEFLDPDCDTCALDGVCASGCAQVDLDCPLGGEAGEFCGGNDSCEDRLCIEATDDPRVKYCSVACDDNDPEIADCLVPMTCIDNQCRYAEPTPSTQGAACSVDDNCRSQICDLDNGICAEPCSSDSECGDEFACEDVAGRRACTVPAEGGCLGCGLSGSWRDSAGTGTLLILLVIVYGAAARRRKRRRAS